MSTAAGDARWCDLPEDLLSAVCSRVASAVVRARFAAVCRSWRDTASRQPTAAPAAPLLLLSPSRRGGTTHQCGPDDGWVLRVPNRAANKWFVGSHDGGWVAACDDSVLVIVNLFTGAEVGLSRKQSTITALTEGMTSSTILPTLPALSLSLKQSTISSTRPPTLPLLLKIIFSEDPSSSNCCMLAAIMRGRFRIGLCRVGCPEGEWTTCYYWDVILDIAFCNGELYGLRFDNTLIKFEIGMKGDGTPVITATHRLTIQSRSIPTLLEHGCNIFELHGELSMVVRTRWLPNRGPTLRVFKLVDIDTDRYYKYRWDEVTSFGDCALFLDLTCCKAVHVPVGAEQHGLERNHIYYFDTSLMEKKLPGDETY